MPTAVNRLAPLVGLAGFAAALAWAASWTGKDRSALLDVFRTVATPWPILWLAPALGFGWPLRRLVPAASGSTAAAIQCAAGVSALLLLDAALGAAGLLNGASTWVLTSAGIGLLLIQLTLSSRDAAVPLPPPRLWLAAPAVAALVVAACSPPGWLWGTEFSGYDALSYHLQLPREWHAAGVIRPGAHNVYGWLPGYVEAAYLHLMFLAGDELDAAIAAQLLQATLSIATALVIGTLAAQLCGAERFAGAVVLAIGTPWLVVVGSLAYNEVPIVLALAGAWLVIECDERPSARAGALVGLLVAAACGAKLTALLVVAVPVGALLLRPGVSRGTLLRLGSCAACAAIGLTPWLVRNQLAGGSPVFPFATGLFGLAHWTADQAAAWAAFHAGPDGLASRLVAAWNEFARYGIGPPPSADPWRPQWLLLPWLGVAGCVVALRSPRYRRVGATALLVLGLQLVLWIAFTHVKSRFMLPAIVPCVIGVAAGAAAMIERRGAPGRVVRALAVVALVAWSAAPLFLLRGEMGGAPAARIGLLRAIVGDALTTDERQRLAASNALIFVNQLLPANARLLLVGEAAPFFYDVDLVYTTPWDRGPLSFAMDDHGDDASAWFEDLAAQGFTHLLVHPRMLDRSARAGWGDPRLTGSAVIDAADRELELVGTFRRGRRVYRMSS